MSAIRSFRGEFAFLSNFAAAPIRMRGVVYPTVEHAYQAAKTLDLAKRREIQEARTAGQAKRLGRSLKLRADWMQICDEVMLGCLRQKFSREPLRSRLLATGDRELVEGNSWHDNYWGSCNCARCNGNGTHGRNRLGELLMQVRAELQTARSVSRRLAEEYGD